MRERRTEGGRGEERHLSEECDLREESTMIIRLDGNAELAYVGAIEKPRVVSLVKAEHVCRNRRQRSVHERLLQYEFPVRERLSMLEPECEQEVDQEGLLGEGCNIGKVVLVVLCEPEDLLEEKLAVLLAKKLIPNFERAYL
jgi:hypothetical protein